ncbi:MAG: hypothetical protein M1334_00420 [Patescibacteria group bacterium]|nr:hypothetical protein [Patescibacteria group bacterium]
MRISIRFKIINLKGGTFLPHFTVVEWAGDKALITDYNIDGGPFLTENEAKSTARYNAIKMVQDKYGNDVEIDLPAT